MDLQGPRLSSEAGIAAHRAMIRIRRVEEAIAARYGQQKMRCPTHLCIGQEAIPVGISAHLLRHDQVYSGHRSHGHYLAKGGDLNAMLAELHGRESGCARGRGGSQHLIDLDAGFIASAPILAGTTPIAVGAAMAMKRLGTGQVAVVYFGDGAIEEGVSHEAINFASVHRLPVIFVCENNLYSVHSRLEIRQPANRPISAIAKAYAMPGLTADGNDIACVHAAGGAAIARARSGEGPTLLEFMTYRWKEHCGPNPDDELGYRSPEEIEAWRAVCPILRSRRALEADGFFNAADMDAAEATIAQEIAAAFEFAESSAFPPSSEMARYTYPQAIAGSNR
jgi:pyruvate dehydrogenase E1 component alpha subunit